MSWAGFLGKQLKEISFGSCDAELYYEAEDFDDFLKLLEAYPDIEQVHPVVEHDWGQRAIRIYDPDHHVIEVAEPLGKVCLRFRDSGLNEEGIARRMEIPVEYVREELKKA